MNKVKVTRKTIKQRIIELFQRGHDLCDRSQKFFTNVYRDNLKMKKQIHDLKKNNDEVLELLRERLDYQEEVLSDLRKIATCSEETLLNVLLAIRQNEYLKAYYPAQNGYPDMNVVGCHPSKLDERAKMGDG